MELFDGHLFVHLNLGTGAAKVRASRKPLNDGNWHRVELTLKNKVGRITVDGNTEAFESPGESLWSFTVRSAQTLGQGFLHASETVLG